MMTLSLVLSNPSLQPPPWWNTSEHNHTGVQVNIIHLIYSLSLFTHDHFTAILLTIYWHKCLFYLSKIYKNKVASVLCYYYTRGSVLFFGCVRLGRSLWFPVPFCSTGGRKTHELKVFGLVHVRERRRALVKSLDEMDLSLVLPCPRGFDGPPFPGESYIPALILGILEGRVIVL